MRKELMQPSTKKTVVEGWCFFFSRNEFVEVCSTQTTFSVLFESLAKVQGALEKARTFARSRDTTAVHLFNTWTVRTACF